MLAKHFFIINILKMATASLENPNYKKALGYLKDYPPLAIAYFNKSGISKKHVLSALKNAVQSCLEVAEYAVNKDDQVFEKYLGLAEKIMDIEDELEGCKT